MKKIAAGQKPSGDKKRRLSFIPWKTYLIYLIIASALMTGMSYAKYGITISGDDTVGVAAPLLSLQYDQATIPLDKINPDDDSSHPLSCKFSVSNSDGSKYSDIAMEYEIVLTTSNKLPVTIKLYSVASDLTESLLFTLSGDGSGTAVDESTSSLISMPLDDEEIVHDYKIYIYWNSGANPFTYSDKTDTVTVKINWQQDL